MNNLEQDKKDKDARLDEHRKEVESLSTKVEISQIQRDIFDNAAWICR